MADLRRRSVVVPTGLGWLQVEFTTKGIVALRLGKRRAVHGDSSTESLPYDLGQQLQRYALGEPIKFRVRFDLAGATPFQQRVWRVLQTIPYGETRSYGWVARRIGQPRAARAVGAACRANPMPIIIPCHRVVARDGSLGGFSGGLRWKKRLLALEQRR